MHALVFNVTIKDRAQAEQVLKERIVPGVSQMPGFVAGYWLRPEHGNQGLSVAVFESEEAARAAAENVRAAAPPATVTLDSVEVREVVAHA